MPPEQAQLIRRWHEESHAALRATLPADVMFMGLRLHITENVMPLDEARRVIPTIRLSNEKPDRACGSWTWARDLA
jgi:hypothetical protein